MSFGPPVPGFIDRVNFISRYFWNGCEAPFQLFCQFAGPPAGRAVAMLIGLDMQDIVKEFFRPAGLRSHRHGRKGARGRKGPPDLPDPNDAIAKRVPGQAVVAGRPYGAPTRWLFEFSDQLDRAAWNIAIFDVVTDTTYQALLGIIEADKSKCPWMRRGKADGRWIIHITTGPQYGATPCPVPVYEKGVQMLHAGCQLPPGGMFLVTFEQTFHQFGPGTSTTSIGIWDDTTHKMLDTSEDLTLAPGEGGTLSCSASVPGGHTIIWMIKNNFAHVSGAYVVGQAIQMGQ